MGTRSLTIFKDSDDKEIVVLYRQYDGYLSGHGLELAEILAGRVVVNGYTDESQFNGMSCLAAQVVAKLKDGVGNVYLYPPGTRDMGEEYIYEISANIGEEPMLTVSSEYPDSTVVFEGSSTDALNSFGDE